MGSLSLENMDEGTIQPAFALDSTTAVASTASLSRILSPKIGPCGGD
jgi:hypothetical protein